MSRQQLHNPNTLANAQGGQQAQQATYNPYGGIGGHGLPNQGPSPGLVHTLNSPMATGQQFEALSGLYAAGTAATATKMVGATFGTAIPFGRAFLETGFQGTRLAGAAKNLRMVDPYYGGFKAAGHAYKGIAGSAASTSTRFLSTGLRAGRVAGGLAAGTMGIATLGLATAATETIFQAGEMMYQGAANRARGESFANTFVPTQDFSVSSSQAQNLGVHGGFLDQLQSTSGLNMAGVEQLTGQLQQQGSLGGTKNLGQFKSKLMSKLRQLKELSDEANVGIGEANQLIEAMKGMGHTDSVKGGAKAAVSALMGRAGATGMDPGALLQIGATGAQASFQAGMGRAYGSTMYQNLAGSLSDMYKNQSVNRSYIDALGGKEAVAVTMSNKLMQATPTFGMMFTKVDKSGKASIDYEKIQEIRSGDTTLEKEFQKIMNPKSMSQLRDQQKRMQAFLDNPNLTGQIHEQSTALIQQAALSDPSSLQNVLGMHKRQVGILGGMLQGAGANSIAAQNQVMANRAMAEMQRLSGASDKFGFDTMMGRMVFENTGFNNLFRDLGVGISDMGRSIAAPFKETETVRGEVTSGELAAYQDIMKRRAQGESFDALKLDHSGSKGFTHKKYGKGTYNMGGMIFGGVDSKLREDIGADGRYARFTRRFGDMTTGDGRIGAIGGFFQSFYNSAATDAHDAAAEGLTEGYDYLHLDTTGSNLFVHRRDEVVADLGAIRRDVRREQEAQGQFGSQYGGTSRSISRNVLRDVQEQGMFDRMRGNADNTMSDSQLNKIVGMFEDRGYRFTKQGYGPGAPKIAEQRAEQQVLDEMFGRDIKTEMQDIMTTGNLNQSGTWDGHKYVDGPKSGHYNRAGVPSPVNLRNRMVREEVVRVKSSLNAEQQATFDSKMQAKYLAGVEMTNMRDKQVQAATMLKGGAREGLGDEGIIDQAFGTGKIDFGFSEGVEGSVRNALVGKHIATTYESKRFKQNYYSGGGEFDMYDDNQKLLFRTGEVIPHGMEGSGKESRDYSITKAMTKDLTMEQMYAIAKGLRASTKDNMVMIDHRRSNQRIRTGLETFEDDLRTAKVNPMLASTLKKSSGDEALSLAEMFESGAAAIGDVEQGRKIAENIQSIGTTQGSYLRSIGVSGGVISALQSYATIAKGDAGRETRSNLGSNLLLTGLQAGDAEQSADYFKGLAMAGFAMQDVAAAGYGLMSKNKKEREKAARAIGADTSKVEKQLTAEQTTALLKERGLLDLSERRLKGSQGGVRQIGKPSFSNSVMEFQRAVSIFAANSGGDASNENLNNNVGYSAPKPKE